MLLHMVGNLLSVDCWKVFLHQKLFNLLVSLCCCTEGFRIFTEPGQPTSHRFAVLQLQGLLHLLMSFGVVAFHHDLIIITIAVVQRTPFDAFWCFRSKINGRWLLGHWLDVARVKLTEINLMPSCGKQQNPFGFGKDLRNLWWTSWFQIYLSLNIRRSRMKKGFLRFQLGHWLDVVRKQWKMAEIQLHSTKTNPDCIKNRAIAHWCIFAAP